MEHDLTGTNPTQCDLPYPPDLLRPLADREGLRYAPDPQGMALAREAVAALIRVPPEAGPRREEWRAIRIMAPVSGSGRS